MTRRTVDLRSAPALFELVSHGRRGPAHVDRLPPATVARISRTVRRVPEVLVKVSGGGTSTGAVLAHLKYIDRHGRLDLETDTGDRANGKGAERRLVEDWGLDLDEAEGHQPYRGKPGRKPAKLVHNLVLSMPAGTSPEKLQAAAQHFARETFALKHRYAMALHTDQRHPHVHLVVQARGADGQRLNIRKAMLREWRERFAEALSLQGIEANATPRGVRGQYGRATPSPLYQAVRHRRSWNQMAREGGAERAVSQRTDRPDPVGEQLRARQRKFEGAWMELEYALHEQGHAELSRLATEFYTRMPTARSDRELAEKKVRDRLRERERTR